MCFSFRLSVLTTLTHYSALYFFMKYKMYKNKSLLYIAILLSLTTGIIEPLEGILHYNIDNSSGKINDELKKIIINFLYLQPAFAILTYVFLQIDKPINNNLLITMLCLYYIYCNNDMKIIIESNKYNIQFKPSNNIDINKDNYIFGIIHIILTLLPIFLLSFKRNVFGTLLILNILILLSIKYVYSDRFIPSLWCFITSFSLWIVIIIERM